MSTSPPQAARSRWLPPGWWVFVIVEAGWLTLATTTSESFYSMLAWLGVYVALTAVAAWGWASLVVRPEDPRTLARSPELASGMMPASATNAQKVDGTVENLRRTMLRSANSGRPGNGR